MKVPPEITGRWMAFRDATHDIGKASPSFQAKRANAVKPLCNAGFDFHRLNDHPHGFISTAVLKTLLQADGERWAKR